MATFSVIMVEVRGANNEDFSQVIVTDGIGEGNHDIVGFHEYFMINVPKSMTPLKLVRIFW